MKLLASTIALAAGTSAFAPGHMGIPKAALNSALRMSDEADGEVEAAPAPVEEVAPPPVASVDSGAAALADLKSMAVELNPVVKFYDPLNLADGKLFNDQTEAIGFLRHAEIKHGRVAMAAFVGYCVQSNFHFPYAQTTAGDMFPSTDLSPEAQWDAIPAAAKWQIILFVGFLEFWGEWEDASDEPHYMRGGQPGKFPTFDVFREEIHFTLDLYDPFGFARKQSQEQKDKRLLMEINNGRLAMLGIFGFLSADTVEGSVPLLNGVAIHYDGNVMLPFEA